MVCLDLDKQFKINFPGSFETAPQIHLLSELYEQNSSRFLQLIFYVLEIEPKFCRNIQDRCGKQKIVNYPKIVFQIA